MFFFSKQLFIIPLVLFFIGISLIPMADSELRSPIEKNISLTEEEKEEAYQRCLEDIPSNATIAERTVATRVCKHILTQYYTETRASKTIIDDQKQFIKTCEELHHLYEAMGHEAAQRVVTNPRVKHCIILYNDPIWDYEGENRTEVLWEWYNEYAEIAKEVLAEENEQTIPESISSKVDEQAETNAEKQPAGGGCLIATATFGTELAPQVQQLRELRDNYLMKTESGSTFMNGFNELYYTFSPDIADLERESPIFKEAVKLTITPLISSLSILNYVDIDSESEVLGYGIGIIMMNIGMYFIAPTVAIIHLKKRFN